MVFEQHIRAPSTRQMPVSTYIGNCCKTQPNFPIFPIYREVLAIRRIFSLVDILIKNTKFSNCPNVFKIGVVWQFNMHSRQQNTFQSDSPFAIPCKSALSTPHPSFNAFIMGAV